MRENFIIREVLVKIHTYYKFSEFITSSIINRQYDWEQDRLMLNTLNTKRHYGLNVKMSNYYIFIHLNKLISEMMIARRHGCRTFNS